jgi:protein arginine N-methyltransferase 7
MGKLTRRVLRANAMENKVKVFHKRSDELRVGVELDSRADILVITFFPSQLNCHAIFPALIVAKTQLRKSIDLAPLRFVQVSEILDSELLGEGLIPTLQHAHDELLVKNPKTVPYGATTYGVVSSACCLLNISYKFFPITPSC